MYGPLGTHEFECVYDALTMLQLKRIAYTHSVNSQVRQAQSEPRIDPYTAMRAQPHETRAHFGCGVKAPSEEAALQRATILVASAAPSLPISFSKRQRGPVNIQLLCIYIYIYNIYTYTYIYTYISCNNIINNMNNHSKLIVMLIEWQRGPAIVPRRHTRTRVTAESAQRESHALVPKSGFGENVGLDIF